MNRPWSCFTLRGEIPALVTDINLGRDKLSGWEVARHGREIDPAFPVVYMSGNSAEDWASKGVPHSIMLAKPFAPARLVTAVSQLLNMGYADKLEAVAQLAASFISNRCPVSARQQMAVLPRILFAHIGGHRRSSLYWDFVKVPNEKAND